MNDLTPSKPEAIKRYDNPRPLFPGEPVVDMVAGVAAWLITRKHHSLAMRTLGTFIGAALVARAAHGRRRLSSVMRWTPIGGGIRRG